MKVILFGATGMVGQGVLRECLLDPEVTAVTAVMRSAPAPGTLEHAKLRVIVHPDFADFSSLKLDGEACFWCLGVTSSGMTEADYTRITYDYTMAAAKVLARPTLTFIFVSGTGADGKAMWARVKKRTEQALFELPFKAVYVFRPGMIQALHGIKSRTRLYNVLYPILAPVIWTAKLVTPKHVTTTERVGQAMLRIAKSGYAKNILENPDINTASGI
ncbi:MAG TPA: epimerase [Polyangia bacterium]|jgi:uncharacterized protein YbjT (DUF2867 family)|nr:epimerase [Polyangia bacterium]